ncbi:MAG: hypothetical protein H7070_07910 [Saprospiraceae bacterium]|nr:hypothetical protein [Pyrinomonadaceae bacterium]
MSYKRLLTFGFTIISLMSLSSNAYGCACCAAPGEYSISTGKVDTFYIDILKGLRFDETATLFLTEADFAIIKGLDDLKRESDSDAWIASRNEFDLVNTFIGKTWKFDLRSKTGKAGVLTLPLPTQILTFKVDIHDDEPDRPNGPMLYKELRFKGVVTGGTGIFRAGVVKPTSYFLVFQGRGNGCDNVSDFTHWRLEVDGRKASYAFHGKLSSGTERSDASTN